MSSNSAPQWDQLSIETPELVEIDMPVAGIGSRFVALLIDYLILIIAGSIYSYLHWRWIAPSLSLLSKVADQWENAIYGLILFVWYWGYFTLFEAFWNGRTPGKKIAKIRVIQRSGRGIGLFESLTRNLLRVIDQIPIIYVVGTICIFVTRQHQRLGDLAAGTLVVHEREQLSVANPIASTRTFTAGIFEAAVTLAARPRDFEVAASNIQRLGADDLEVLEAFFVRRLDFSMETRASLAQRISGAICAKAGLEVPLGISTETFLEEVARQLRDLVRIR